MYPTRHNGTTTKLYKNKNEVIPAPKQVGNTRATCTGVIDRAIPSLAAHSRMAGQCMLDVFGGPGFLANASNHLGLRGHVLDTKFGLDLRGAFESPLGARWEHFGRPLEGEWYRGKKSQWSSGRHFNAAFVGR